VRSRVWTSSPHKCPPDALLAALGRRRRVAPLIIPCYAPWCCRNRHLSGRQGLSSRSSHPLCPGSSRPPPSPALSIPRGRGRNPPLVSCATCSVDDPPLPVPVPLHRRRDLITSIDEAGGSRVHQPQGYKPQLDARQRGTAVHHVWRCYREWRGGEGFGGGGHLDRYAPTLSPAPLGVGTYPSAPLTSPWRLFDVLTWRWGH